MESPEKFKAVLGKAFEDATVHSASTLKPVGRVHTSRPTERGIAVYLELDGPIASSGSGAVSIEIPLHTILDEEQVRVCPSRDGWYRAILASGKTIEAKFEMFQGRWTVKGVQIGIFHDIVGEDGKGDVVVGIKRLGDDEPDWSPPCSQEGDFVP